MAKKHLLAMFSSLTAGELTDIALSQVPMSLMHWAEAGWLL